MTIEVVANDFQTLEAMLLTLGGKSVAKREEMNVNRLLEDGKVFETTNRRKIHTAAAVDCMARPEDRDIVDGWALGKDGVWDQHSWTVENAVVIRDSGDFVAFYGVVLTGEDAAYFITHHLITTFPGYGDWIEEGGIERFIGALEDDEEAYTIKEIGYITVDTAMCWIGDPGYVMHDKPNAIGKDWDDFCRRVHDEKNEPRYAHQFNHDNGCGGLGVVVRSGFGDGIYPVTAVYNKLGLIERVSVNFTR